MKKYALSFFIALAGILTPLVSTAAPMTNADVIKMVKSGIDDEVIITSIQHAENGFDSSANGLIQLSEAKVSKPVVNAVIKRASSVTTATTSSSSATAENPNGMKASDIYMIDGSETKVMRYITAQSRTAARALGMGGMATYSVLRGRTATMRTANKTPSFIVAIPDQAQAESYFTLASFEVRKNDTREVMTGGGYMSYSSGIHKNRVVEVTSEKIADQSRAPKSFTIYKLTPVKPMNAGEYALVLYTGELQSLVGTWFTAGSGNSYFDFGIDK